jgi:hypothetical protein
MYIPLPGFKLEENRLPLFMDRESDVPLRVDILSTDRGVDSVRLCRTQ